MEILYCTRCNHAIPPGGLDEGRHFRLGDEIICPKCYRKAEAQGHSGNTVPVEPIKDDRLLGTNRMTPAARDSGVRSSTTRIGQAVKPTTRVGPAVRPTTRVGPAAKPPSRTGPAVRPPSTHAMPAASKYPSSHSLPAVDSPSRRAFDRRSDARTRLLVTGLVLVASVVTAALVFLWVSGRKGDESKPPRGSTPVKNGGGGAVQPRPPPARTAAVGRPTTPGPAPRPPAGSPVSLAASLVAHWNFEDGSGPIAKDSSPGGSDGKVQGATWVPGQVGGALGFNGSSDYVWVNAQSLARVADSFTMALWARPTAPRDRADEAVQGTAGGKSQRYALFPAKGIGNQSSAGLSIGNNGVSVIEHADDYMPPLLVHDAPLSGWTHVAVVYEKRQPRLYLSGRLIKKGLASTRTVHPMVSIGGCKDAETYGFYQGDLDDVRIYNRVLSAEEIAGLACAGGEAPKAEPKPDSAVPPAAK